MKNKKTLHIIALIIIIICEGFFIWNNKLVEKTEEEKEEYNLKKETLEVSKINIKNYKESLKEWGELKEQKGNSYFYQASFSSSEGCYGQETKITVKDGVPIAREYKESTCEILKDPLTLNITREEKILEQYSEDASNLGTNEKGSQAVTIDFLYKECKGNLGVSSKKNETYFEADEEGIIKYCGYVPRNCADDCYEGVLIDYFEWIK